MNIEVLREYCLKKNEVSEGFPFDENVLVFKVAGKIFLLTPLDAQPLQFNAKCDPERAIGLREQYPAITAGYHMNKRLWNTIVADGTIHDKLIFELIDHSYNEVVNTLPKKTIARLATGH